MSQTLKRPMFRKGGPVMEGIMDGIVDRQPMKKGGDTIGGGVIQGQDMGNNRTGFGAPFLAAAGVGALNVARAAAPFVSRFGRQGIANIKKIPGFFRTKVEPFFRSKIGREVGLKRGVTTVDGKTVTTVGEGTKFVPNYLGRDPLVRLVGSTYRAATSPTATGFGQKAVQFATSPTGIIGGGILFNPFGDDEDDKKQDIVLEGFDDENKTKKKIQITVEQKKKLPLETDPKKGLEDIYNENKAVIEKILDTGDQDTRAQLFLKLAEFGANLASEPGGNLVAAASRAAKEPIKGLGKVVSDRRREQLAINKLALSKTFEDTAPSKQLKLLKEVQKELIEGGNKNATLSDAVRVLNPQKEDPRIQLEFSKQIVEDVKQTGGGVSETGVLNDGVKALEDAGRLDMIGLFIGPGKETYESAEKNGNLQDAAYYTTKAGKFIRYYKGKMYTTKDPEFFAKTKEVKKT